MSQSPRPLPCKLRWPLLGFILFVIYSYATYQHPLYAEGRCPPYAVGCECVDNACAMLAYTVATK